MDNASEIVNKIYEGNEEQSGEFTALTGDKYVRCL